MRTETDQKEKTIERRLTDGIKEMDGMCIKLYAGMLSGLPDRLILLPGGFIYFVETKAPGKKPRKLQLIIHRKMNRLGFPVHVIDTMEKVNEFLIGLKLKHGI